MDMTILTNDIVTNTARNQCRTLCWRVLDDGLSAMEALYDESAKDLCLIIHSYIDDRYEAQPCVVKYITGERTHDVFLSLLANTFDPDKYADNLVTDETFDILTSKLTNFDIAAGLPRHNLMPALSEIVTHLYESVHDITPSAERKLDLINKVIIKLLELDYIDAPMGTFDCILYHRRMYCSIITAIADLIQTN